METTTSLGAYKSQIRTILRTIDDFQATRERTANQREVCRYS